MPEAKRRGKFQKKTKTNAKSKTKRGGKRKDFFRKKVCKFCLDKVDKMDYKDVNKLRKFITEKGKILPGRMTGNCARHQRVLALAVKKARYIALLPFVGE